MGLCEGPQSSEGGTPGSPGDTQRPHSVSSEMQSRTCDCQLGHSPLSESKYPSLTHTPPESCPRKDSRRCD